MNLLLIAGHGAGDPGAVGNGCREADETRAMVSLISKHLKDSAQVDIYPTDRNAFSDYRSGVLRDKARFPQYDYVLEVHFNAFVSSSPDGKTKGSEIYYTSKKGEAGVILEHLVKLGFTDRGVKSSPYSVTLSAQREGTPAALLEVCFIDDGDDMLLYLKDREAVAKSISQGIIKAFGLTEKEDDFVSYEQFVQYMERYENERAVRPPDSWSQEARNWAESNGLVRGDEDGAKRYKSHMTREEMTEMMYRQTQIGR